MKALITGMSGFAGAHLASLLRAMGQEPCPPLLACGREDLCAHADITDIDDVRQLIRKVQPERLYHLAAAASVGASWKQREYTFEVNVGGTRNIAQALLEIAPRCRMLFISSGSIYGPSLGRPFREDDELHPGNPYAESKVEAEKVCLAAAGRGLDVRIVRPLGHCGPGQSKGFVVPDFASQVAAIKLGRQEPVIKVGRIDVRREFSDVRDIIRAYHLIMENGEPGTVYNLASNQSVSIRRVLELLIEIAGIKAEIVEDKSRLRPADESSPILDTSRVMALGFKFNRDLRTTLNEVLDDQLKALSRK